MGSFGTQVFPTLQVGELRHWVEFLQPMNTMGPAGLTPGWSPTVPVIGGWAKIESPKGDDRFSGGLELSINTLQISMWWSASAYANQHIYVYRGGGSVAAEYVILSLENVLLMNNILVLQCQAIGSQANQGG